MTAAAGAAGMSKEGRDRKRERKKEGDSSERMKKYEVLGNLTPGLPSLRGPVDPGSWVRLGGIRKTTAARQRGDGRREVKRERRTG